MDINSSTSGLVIIQNELNRYGFTVFMILGNIGNAFIIIVFSRQRQNACSIYLLSLAIMNDLYLTFNSFVQIFPFYYVDQTTTRAFAVCKLRFYLSNVLGQLAKTMMVLACFDRFMITNNRATFRAFSTPKRAKWLIFLSIIFWSLFASHIAIMTTIINGRCMTFGIYSIVYSVYTMLFVGLIPPILVSIFGYLTYHHMRQIHIRIQPIVNNVVDAKIFIQQRDRELLIMVISEVVVYVITATPYLLIVLEMMITRFTITNKSIWLAQIENFIFTIAFLLLFANNAAPFFIYLISSRLFRRDFKQTIMNYYRKLRRQTPVQIVDTINHNLMKQETHV